MKDWCIIIPYRDRMEHLEKFVPHYKAAFPDVPIYIIEQDDSKPFNRGKLLNVGFLESSYYDYYCMHDVDMLAVEFDAYKIHPVCPTHLATHCSQFSYKLPYPEYFGGVNLFNHLDFTRINGYTNELYGWGIEDDNLFERVMNYGLTIDRRCVTYECFDHPRPMDHTLYRSNLEKFKQGLLSSESGIRNCQYTVSHVGKLLDCIHIKVSL